MFMVNVGKYASPMDPMGKGANQRHRGATKTCPICHGIFPSQEIEGLIKGL